MIEGKVKQVSSHRYFTLDRLSATDLRLFSTSRKDFFRKVILKERVEETYNRSMLIGEIVHCLLLEDEEAFSSKFHMSECSKVPTGKMLEFVECLYKQTCIYMDEEGVLTKDFEYVAKEAHIESGSGLRLGVLLSRFEGKDPESYYKELLSARLKNKKAVCVADITIAEKIVNTAKSHRFTNEVLTMETNSDYTVLNEQKFEGYSIDGVEMKSMMDKIIIDHVNKEIQPWDLKVVWDNENFYREYYLKKRADIQGYVYRKALEESDIPGLSTKEKNSYFINPLKFITVDSGNFTSPLIYPIKLEDHISTYTGFEVNSRKYMGVQQILSDIKWHMEGGDWTMSKEAYDNGGVMKLKFN